jgi:hypothetical protein
MLINCTPHTLAIHAGEQVIEMQASGIVPRRTLTRTATADTDGIPTVRPLLGEVTGLPDAVANTYLIVSGLVLAACPDRPDLRSPGEAVRDADGKIVGCRGLCA